jgi:hypothetical protein
LITDVEVEELAEVNSIKIIVTGQGDYEYSLDDEFGFTKNPIISTQPGIHDVFVKDKNGCGTASKKKRLLFWSTKVLYA